MTIIYKFRDPISVCSKSIDILSYFKAHITFARRRNVHAFSLQETNIVLECAQPASLQISSSSFLALKKLPSTFGTVRRLATFLSHQILNWENQLNLLWRFIVGLFFIVNITETKKKTFGDSLPLFTGIHLNFQRYLLLPQIFLCVHV